VARSQQELRTRTAVHWQAFVDVAMFLNDFFDNGPGGQNQQIFGDQLLSDTSSGPFGLLGCRLHFAPY